jgi:hypothetical protein
MTCCGHRLNPPFSPFPNPAKFDPEKGLSTGEWTQRLVEMTEILAGHVIRQADEFSALCTRLAAVEGRA